MENGRTAINKGHQANGVAPKTPEGSPQNADQPARSPLGPAPLLTPVHRVNLAPVAMGALPQATPVESLVVRELKGIAAAFTPNTSRALQFRGFVYKPEGEFEACHQIIAGELLSDPRIASRASTIIFIPSFAWSTCEVVLAPFKSSRHGMRQVTTFQGLQPRFPNFKLFSEWNSSKLRHVVHEVEMTPQERELISKVSWPTREQILEALQVTAFDNIEGLAAANTDIATLLTSREIE